MVANFLGRLKKRRRFALAILFVGACGYAIDRWFLAGVMASKWIGLSEYEQRMKELQKQSEIWGDVALVLGIVAFVLILPTWPARSKSEATHGILTATPEQNIWIEYFLQCVFRAGIILFGAFILAVMVPIAANFLHTLLSTR
jgi:ABC-type polysaccharide transport system permease subunit